jgi:hypothetical protein
VFDGFPGEIDYPVSISGEIDYPVSQLLLCTRIAWGLVKVQTLIQQVRGET